LPTRSPTNRTNMSVPRFQVLQEHKQTQANQANSHHYLPGATPNLRMFFIYKAWMSEATQCLFLSTYRPCSSSRVNILSFRFSSEKEFAFAASFRASNMPSVLVIGFIISGLVELVSPCL